MSDISLLPEDMREKEDQKKDGIKPPAISGAGGLRMHVPDAEPEEDIEIIEVDEGDLASVLADEPLMTRLTYKLSSAIDGIRGKLFEKRGSPPPAKVPPQFFKPPKPGLVSRPASPTSATIRPVGQGPIQPAKAPAAEVTPTGVARSVRPPSAFSARAAAGGSGVGSQNGETRARITPQPNVPRRVRVIRRVRRPVRVSLISSKELAALTVDVSKRKWTISVVACIFLITLVVGRLFLDGQVSDAKSRLEAVQAELQSTHSETQERLKTWSSFEDLQDRLELLDGVLKRHIIISRFFDFLETRTIPAVTYTNASWSSEGSLTLDVVTDSFESAARQLVAFKESDVVKRADSTSFSITKGEEGKPNTVTFQIILMINPLVFQGAGLMPVNSAASSSVPAS